MYEILKPYITEILQALIGVLVLFLLAALQSARKKAEAWLASKTTASQRELLQKIGQEAFVHAETVYKGMGGEAKLQGAYDYATAKLRTAGIDMTSEEIRAAIHKAWLDFQAQVRPEALNGTTTSSEQKVI